MSAENPTAIGYKMIAPPQVVKQQVVLPCPHCSKPIQVGAGVELSGMQEMRLAEERQS
jgi:hypothetical protein